MPYLHLVRHGQPDFAGDYDSLTDLGAQQSRWLGAHFAARRLNFARVVSGTLRRQVDTCDQLLEQLPGSPSPERAAGLNEYDHASLLAFFEGDNLATLRATGDRRGYFLAMRHALQQWSSHDAAIGNGESWRGFGDRIQAAVSAACDGLGRDDRVLLVTSGGVIGRYTADALGADASIAIELNLQTRNTGVTEIVRSTSGTLRLVAFNAVPHLEVAGREQAVTFS